MNPVLRDYRMLWRAAMAKRDARTYAALCGSALFGALFAGLLSWWKTGDAFEVLLNGIRAVYALLILGSMLYFVPGIIRLNTPANARLVPRMRRRAMQLTVLVWMAVTAASTLLALGSPLGAPIVFLSVGFWLIATGLARSGHRAGVQIQFLVPTTIMLGVSFGHAWQAQLAGTPVLASAALLTLPMIALGAYTLKTMFPHGGDRHFRLRDAQKVLAGPVTMEGQSRTARSSRSAAWGYRAVLRRDCARRDAGALLMHLLGPGVHGLQRWLVPLCGAAVVVLVLLAVRDFATPAMHQTIVRGSWVFVSSALLVQVFDHQQRLARLALTRGEQCLLKLAPAMPGAAAQFNRRLGAGLLRTAVTSWAIVSAGALGIVAIAGAPAAILSVQACMCCLTLPLAAWALRDHAHAGGSAGWQLAGWFVLSVGSCLAAGMVAARLFATPVMPAAALAAVVLTAGSGTWRWRRLAGAPHAFPVGRIA